MEIDQNREYEASLSGKTGMQKHEFQQDRLSLPMVCCVHCGGQPGSEAHTKARKSETLNNCICGQLSFPHNSSFHFVEKLDSEVLVLDPANDRMAGGLLAALKRIAAFSDVAASNKLYATGSYSAFDEPGSVEIARDALATYAQLKGANAEEAQSPQAALPLTVASVRAAIFDVADKGRDCGKFNQHCGHGWKFDPSDESDKETERRYRFADAVVARATQLMKKG